MTRSLMQCLEEAMINPTNLQQHEISEHFYDSMVEITRLQGLLKSHGINPESEHICSCGLRRGVKNNGDVPF